MSIELPESYWNDVNRWSGELLAGVAPQRTSLLVISSMVQRRSWPAEAEGVTSRLERGSVRILGRLVRLSVFHTLSQLTPGPPGSDNSEYVITYDPTRREIERASSDLEFRMPPEARAPGEVVSGLVDFGRYVNGRNKLHGEIHSLGLDVPSQADYDLLHSELQRGVASLPVQE